MHDEQPHFKIRSGDTEMEITGRLEAVKEAKALSLGGGKVEVTQTNGGLEMIFRQGQLEALADRRGR